MKIFFYLLVVFFILTACQDTKDALTLKKKSSADEFLVEKKSPLVLPPNYGDLPLPNETNVNKQINENNEIKVTLGGDKIKIDETLKNSDPSSIEKSVLEKIK